MTVCCSQGLASSHYYCPSARLKTSDSLENLPYGAQQERGQTSIRSTFQNPHEMA